MIKLGLILLVVTGSLCFVSRRAFNAHNWTPVSIPLPLSASQITQATFVADMDTTYFVQIDLKRRLPFEKIKTLGQPSVEWTVKQGSSSVGEDYSGEYWGESMMGYEIGDFPGRAGRQYRVEVCIRKNARAFKVLDPHLQIAVTPIDTEKYLLQGSVLAFMSLCLFLSSLACFLRGWQQARPPNTRASSFPT